MLTMASDDWAMHTLASGTLENLLFEDPLPVGLSLLVVALVLGFLSIQQGSAKLKKVAAGALTLCVLVFILATIVTTSRESVIERTRTLVSYTAPLKMNEFKALVSPQVRVTVGEDASAPVFTGQDVFTHLENAVRNYPIDAQTIVQIEANSRSDDQIVCEFDIRSDSKGGRVMTRWVLTWQKQSDDQWIVTQVQWIDCPHLIGIKPSAGWLR